MRTHFGSAALAALLGLVLLAPEARGQARDTTSSAGAVSPLFTLGTAEEDRARLRHLSGAPTDGFLVRSPSSLTPALAPGERGWSWSVVVPEVEVAWNSDYPFSLNDGALWAGRGANVLLTTGVRLRAGRVSLTLAPQLVYSENLPFQHAPDDTSVRAPLERSAFSSPWYVGRHSADLPLRFGNQPLARVQPGQSALAVELGPVTAGAATEDQWWGPGVRNAIVLSNQAGGVPHAFVRSSRPLRTRLGAVEGRWIVGGLSESLFFDTVSTNDVRSLSGFAATLRPAAEPDLTLGVARVVYAAVDRPSAVPGRLLDVFTRWGRPPGIVPDSVAADTVPPEELGYEQVLSLFGRWVLPASGVELYAEWARIELPTSVADFVNQPNHTQGYTLGLQWARPVREGSLFRLQTELTFLEESATYDNRPTRGYYVSASVPQGYTERGQMLGAAVGPGGSGQWLAADHLSPGWSVGAFGGRIRWNNDVYYHKPGRLYAAHDVSVFGGVRGGLRLWKAHLQAELLGERRYNYLFQNPEEEPYGDRATDTWNRSIRFSVTPVR